jgi:hypothetical protein
MKSEIEKRNGKAIRNGNFVAKKIITKFRILYPKKFDKKYDKRIGINVGKSIIKLNIAI